MSQPILSEHRPDAPGLNLLVGMVKGGGSAAITLLAAQRLGAAPMVIAGGVLSGVEFLDCIKGATRTQTPFHNMASSWAGRNGFRSMQKGVQFALMGYFARGLLQTGQFPLSLAGLALSASSTGLLTYSALSTTGAPNSDKGFTFNTLALLGLTYRPLN